MRIFAVIKLHGAAWQVTSNALLAGVIDQARNFYAPDIFWDGEECFLNANPRHQIPIESPRELDQLVKVGLFREMSGLVDRARMLVPNRELISWVLDEIDDLSNAMPPAYWKRKREKPFASTHHVYTVYAPRALLDAAAA